MSLEGKATADVVLRGTINNLDTLVIDAYDIAVKNGFEGTEEEWLASLKGEQGEPGESADIVVDDALSPTSTNPVQNKVVTAAIVEAAGVAHQAKTNAELTANNLLDTNARVTALEESGGVTDPYKDYQSDVPENIGVLNAILNFKQIAEIPFKIQRTLPQGASVNNDWTDTNKTYYGLPYSSSRIEEGFVPNFVSFETFMTALQNRNSYLYTEDLREYGNKGATYYGTVCSVAAAYALGIVPNYATRQWKYIPGMEALEWQSVHALKLGDTLCSADGGHVIMVTDITRNKRGKIGKITTTEAATTKVIVKEYTPDELKAEIAEYDYVIYRYAKIHEVEHNPSPFVAVEDEVIEEPVYNKALIPRKGDKANWLQGVPVEIDLLEKSGYTYVEVYKDNDAVPFKTEQIGGGDVTPFDRTVYGLGWIMGAVGDKSSLKHIRTEYFSCENIVATVADGAMLRVVWKTADGTDISVSNWLDGNVVFNDIAPDTAMLCVVEGKYSNEQNVDDVNALAAMLDIKVDDNATAMPIAIMYGGLSSSTGAEASNNARFRSGFLPIQNLRIDGTENVEYNIFYYDGNKGYLGRRSSDWLSGQTYVMDGKPEGAAYFRLLGKNKANTSVSTNYYTYTFDLPATIIGGTSEGDLDVLVLENLPYGEYTAYLTDGTNRSKECSWIVVDAVCNAVSSGVGSREATVTFSASNAEPLFVKWAGGKPKDGKPDNGTKHINVLTDEQKAAGVAVCVYDYGDNDDDQNGLYKMRVAFKTKYGIIHTPLGEAITV